MKKKHIIFLAVLGLLIFVTVGSLGGYFLWKLFREGNMGGGPAGSGEGEEFVVEVFKDEDEFKQYLENSEDSFSYGVWGGSPVSMDAGFGMGAPEMEGFNASPDMMDTRQSEPSRYSETNVQVEGIDEPDIVKTNGKEIFLSSEESYRYFGRPIIEDRITFEGSDMDMSQNFEPVLPPESNSATNILKAFPPEDLEELGQIDKKGELLLSGDTLVILSYDQLWGYDVSEPDDPQRVWKYDFEDQSSMVQARLYDGDIYLVTSTYPDYDTPCPVKVLADGSESITVPCTSVYRPSNKNVSAESVYSVIKIEADNGEVKDKTSFVGDSWGGATTVYMSKNAVYIGYYYMNDFVQYFADFLKENEDLFDDDLIEDVENLVEMDISQSAKMTELEQISSRFMNSMDDDELYEFENEMEDRSRDYNKENLRDLDRTGIAKVDIDVMEPEASGAVPGRTLNQFSMDEYDGHLRVATTVGNSFMSGSAETENDVYILDEDLDITGQARGMGLDERIYSVRFIGDKGYVVTFKQIDPFYVLDLSDPEKPSIEGELKIPGFSSYLHPLKNDLILGVGEENGKVKLALFDVSNPSDPVEKDKYIMSDYWSEVGNNHRAFLQDSLFEVFFIPTGNGGNIFSYEDEKITLVKSVSGSRIKRALFIEDNFYIIGEEEIEILDEETWDRVNSVELGS
jgi:uncharacterized secreted protein with C-terminal beta-propeller domain